MIKVKNLADKAVLYNIIEKDVILSLSIDDYAKFVAYIACSEIDEKEITKIMTPLNQEFRIKQAYLKSLEDPTRTEDENYFMAKNMIDHKIGVYVNKMTKFGLKLYTKLDNLYYWIAEH